MMLKIETIQPHEDLKRYIDFYYLIRDDNPDFSNTHYSFPHTVNAVTIYRQASFNSSFMESSISHDPDNDFLSLLQGKRQYPLKVNIAGKTDRICIWFKPLGLNHFITTSLSDIMGKVTNRFISWDSDPAYKACLEICFKDHDPERRIRVLESFLLSKVRTFEPCKMDQAILLLCDFNSAYTIDEIAHLLEIPIRTFNRVFKQLLGVSPVEYRNIARFRNSMNDKLLHPDIRKLTEIGYNSNFYDQSYFIKMYKKLAGAAPSVFFNAVDRLADDKLIFQFV